MNLRRFSPLPQGRLEAALFGLLFLGLAFMLVGCNAVRDSLPATRGYAEEVARDNAAAAAAGNPASAVIHGIATLVAALAGAGILTNRAIKRYDAKPLEGKSGVEVSEERVAEAVLKVEKT